MVADPKVEPSQSTSPLRVTLLLETLASGKVSASIAEFPTYRTEADTKEAAIVQIQTIFLERLQHIEAIAWTVPTPSPEPAWMQFAGALQDDPDLQAIMATIQAQRQADDDSEVDPTYYQ